MIMVGTFPRVREVPNSDVGCPDLFFVVFSVPPGIFIGNPRIVLHCSAFMIHNIKLY
jgi:hypothetical protein